MSTSWTDDFIAQIEKYIREFFFWESDPVRIGKMIRFLHHMTMYSLITLYVVLHTILPSYFLFCILYAWMLFIWVHHICTGGCIVSKVEQRLIGDSVSFIDPILLGFHIPVTPETTSAVVILTSSIIIFMSTMELISRTVLTLPPYLRF
jgi:hypothetical protein